MRLSIDLAGVRTQELHLSSATAHFQLESVLDRHTARGHTVMRAEDSWANYILHYTVKTPEGMIDYRLGW